VLSTGCWHLLAVGKDPTHTLLKVISWCKLMYAVQISVLDSFRRYFYFLDKPAEASANECDSFADVSAPSGFETVLDIPKF